MFEKHTRIAVPQLQGSLGSIVMKSKMVAREAVPKVVVAFSIRENIQPTLLKHPTAIRRGDFTRFPSVWCQPFCEAWAYVN